MQLPVLVSTPHASGFVPFHLLAEMLGEEVFDREARERRLEYLFDEGDPYTDAIFYAPGARHLSALTSRFVVDLNRPRDYGGPNGVIKLTDFQAQPLYPPDYALSPQAAEERLSRYWDPYHAAVDAALARNDISFFIDGHAMSPVGPAIGPDTGKLRPALTLVTGGDARGEPLGSGYTTVAPGGRARPRVTFVASLSTGYRRSPGSAAGGEHQRTLYRRRNHPPARLTATPHVQAGFHD